LPGSGQIKRTGKRFPARSIGEADILVSWGVVVKVVHLVAVEHDFEADTQLGTLVQALAFDCVLAQALGVKRIGVGVGESLSSGIGDDEIHARHGGTLAVEVEDRARPEEFVEFLVFKLPQKVIPARCH